MKGTLLGNSQRKAEIHRNCLFFRCPLQCHGLGTTMPVCSMVQRMGGSVSHLWLITPRDPEEEAGANRKATLGLKDHVERSEKLLCKLSAKQSPTFYNSGF